MDGRRLAPLLYLVVVCPLHLLQLWGRVSHLLTAISLTLLQICGCVWILHLQTSGQRLDLCDLWGEDPRFRNLLRCTLKSCSSGRAVDDPELTLEWVNAQMLENRNNQFQQRSIHLTTITLEGTGTVLKCFVLFCFSQISVRNDLQMNC